MNVNDFLPFYAFLVVMAAFFGAGFGFILGIYFHTKKAAS